MGLFYDYDDGGLRESVVKIYSLRADSWKRIGDFSFGVPYNKVKTVKGEEDCRRFQETDTSEKTIVTHRVVWTFHKC